MNDIISHSILDHTEVEEDFLGFLLLMLLVIQQVKTFLQPFVQQIGTSR